MMGRGSLKGESVERMVKEREERERERE